MQPKNRVFHNSLIVNKLSFQIVWPVSKKFVYLHSKFGFDSG